MSDCALGKQNSGKNGCRRRRTPRLPAWKLLLTLMGMLLLGLMPAFPAIAAAAADEGLPSSNPAWSWISPTAGGDSISAVSFVDADHGWAVGLFKGALSTADGGRTWQAHRFGPPLGSLGVYFADEQHGWAVGQVSDSWDFSNNSEFICATSDGGASWQVQLYAERSLPGLDCIYMAPDLMTGWAAGRASTLYHTNDGGVTWTLVDDLPIPNELHIAIDFIDMQWLSPELGFLYGSGPSSDRSPEQLLLVTSDGGDSWTLRYLPAAEGDVQPLWATYFVDADHGYAVGWGGQVWRTDNGGDDWTNKSPGGAMIQSVTDVYFDDVEHGWAVGTQGRVVSTTDGGDSWTVFDSGIPVGLNTIDRLSPTTLIALGDVGFGLRSDDNGVSWQLLGNGLWNPGSYHISFPTDNEGWIAGNNGALFHTSNGGADWEPVDLGTDVNLTGLQFFSAQQGWVLERAGIVHRTDDGGATWTAIDTNAGVELNNLHFVDEEHGWAVGELGTVVATSDGGESWASQATGLEDVALNKLFFLDPQHGWVAGPRPKGDNTFQSWVAQTTDGGHTWAAATFTELPLSAVTSLLFLDEQRGFAAGWASVGEGGMTGIFQTEDAGATWTYVPVMPLPLQPLTTLDFTSPTRGVALGGFGIAYSTDDGGRTWLPNVRLSPADGVTDTYFRPGSSDAGATGYALTSMGAVAETTVGGAVLHKLSIPLDPTQRPENVEVTLTNTDLWFHDFYLVGLDKDGLPVWDDSRGIASGSNVRTKAGERWSLALDELFPFCTEPLHTLLVYTGEDLDLSGICEVSVAYHWSDIDEDVLAPYGLTEAQLKDVSQGYPDGSWKPYDSMTRAQFVKMAATAYGITPLDPATPTFADVPKDDLFYTYIEGAVAAGLIRGVGDNLFAPYSPVTREQGAAIIARHKAGTEGVDMALGYAGGDAEAALARFSDAGLVSPSLQHELAYAVDEGIIMGSGGLLNPSVLLTRIQGAAMIVRSR